MQGSFAVAKDAESVVQVVTDLNKRNVLEVGWPRLLAARAATGDPRVAAHFKLVRSTMLTRARMRACVRAFIAQPYTAVVNALTSVNRYTRLAHAMFHPFEPALSGVCDTAFLQTVATEGASYVVAERSLPIEMLGAAVQRDAGMPYGEVGLSRCVRALVSSGPRLRPVAAGCVQVLPTGWLLSPQPAEVPMTRVTFMAQVHGRRVVIALTDGCLTHAMCHWHTVPLGVLVPGLAWAHATIRGHAVVELSEQAGHSTTGAAACASPLAVITVLRRALHLMLNRPSLHSTRTALRCYLSRSRSYRCNQSPFASAHTAFGQSQGGRGLACGRSRWSTGKCRRAATLVATPAPSR